MLYKKNSIQVQIKDRRETGEFKPGLEGILDNNNFNLRKYNWKP